MSFLGYIKRSKGKIIMSEVEGGGNMVAVYATLILKGVKTIDDVPEKLHPEVEEMLKILTA